jgi:mono/diheme cytochrome c family protein
MKLKVNLLLCCLVAAGVVLLTSAAKAEDDAAATFKGKCAMCHGPDGKGDTPTGKAMKVRSLTSDEVKKESDADLIGIITKGKGKMPGYDKKLTDDQIKGLIKFIRSLK